MTVHFFYDFKDELIQKVKKNYENELIERKEKIRNEKQLDEAEKLIVDYFKVIKNALHEVFEVSDGDVKYEESDNYILKFTIFKNSLEFARNGNSIKVEVELYDEEMDIIESKILGNIIIGEKRCMVKDTGKLHTGSHFDQKTIDYFMRVAFGKFIN